MHTPEYQEERNSRWGQEHEEERKSQHGSAQTQHGNHLARRIAQEPLASGLDSSVAKVRVPECPRTQEIKEGSWWVCRSSRFKNFSTHKVLLIMCVCACVYVCVRVCLCVCVCVCLSRESLSFVKIYGRPNMYMINVCNLFCVFSPKTFRYWNSGQLREAILAGKFAGSKQLQSDHLRDICEILWDMLLRELNAHRFDFFIQEWETLWSILRHCKYLSG